MDNDNDNDNNTMTKRVAELREIERANNGILTPENVVARAADPTSALHTAFEWDDTEAARKYRLFQARNLINVCVAYEPRIERVSKVYVSLRADREHGGYRHMPTLLKTTQGRADVLDTALWELAAFERKYAALQELADVFAAIKRVQGASITKRLAITA